MKRSPQHPWTQLVFSFLGATAIGLALWTYHETDPSFSTYEQRWSDPQNTLGYLGSWLSDFLFQVFGWSAWLIPTFLCLAPLKWYYNDDKKIPMYGWRSSALGLLLLASTLASDLILVHDMRTGSYPIQGMLGFFTGSVLPSLIGRAGSALIVFSLVWGFCLLWWQDLPQYVVRYTAHTLRYLLTNLVRGSHVLGQKLGPRLSQWAQSMMIRLKSRYGAESRQIKITPAANITPLATPTHLDSSKASELESENLSDSSLHSGGDRVQPIDDEENESETEDHGSGPGIRIRRFLSGESDAQRARPERKRRDINDEPRRPTSWNLPPMSLLKSGTKKIKGPSEADLLQTAGKIREALLSFDIQGEISEISPGPIITVYEFQPAPGVRAQKIMSASVDLAMTLGVPSVRIVAPIPNKSVAGIEVPNREKQEVVLRDVYELTTQKAQTMKLPIVLGKDAEGKDVTEDLSRMPHLLVGGATNMGKSVFVNSILTSLLMRFSPDELRLIIVDPKLVEFKAFEDIPHLMLPIVNDADDANRALKWAVNETKRRYALLQKYGVKNIDGYNQKFMAGKLPADEELEKMFYIVIIVDELAELMLIAKREVEHSIVRLTQLARAAGVHLVMATQRPSADVVTGLIKSNCPSRASLRVASATDSRIILDSSGAEQLIGRGDLFFTNSGPMGLRRMQGCYVTDEEIEAVCHHWTDQGEPEYREEILSEADANPEGTDGAEAGDNLYVEVVRFARDKGKISTSLIQRQFQIGYNRAARLMDLLEKNGVVGESASPGKPREVIA